MFLNQPNHGDLGDAPVVSYSAVCLISSFEYDLIDTDLICF